MAEIDVARASRNRLQKKTESGTSSVKGDGTDFAATEREKLTSGLGSGKTAKGGGSDMPKQNPGEDAGAFGARVAAWRRRKEAGITMDHAAGALAKKVR
jgi:hypothetical protein